MYLITFEYICRNYCEKIYTTATNVSYYIMFELYWCIYSLIIAAGRRNM
jgi:hypothetical protein